MMNDIIEWHFLRRGAFSKRLCPSVFCFLFSVYILFMPCLRKWILQMDIDSVDYLKQTNYFPSCA